MYHISSDVRAQKSAALIWQGLSECLKEKELNKVRISDINEKSYISRATFYRLFDTVEDVLVYRCDQILRQVGEEMTEYPSSDMREMFLIFISKWLEQDALVTALVKNNMTNLLNDVHMRNADLVKKVYVRAQQLSDGELDYLTSILASLIPAAVAVWVSHEKRETPQDLFTSVSKCLGLISSTLK